MKPTDIWYLPLDTKTHISHILPASGFWIKLNNLSHWQKTGRRKDWGIMKVKETILIFTLLSLRQNLDPGMCWSLLGQIVYTPSLLKIWWSSVCRLLFKIVLLTSNLSTDIFWYFSVWVTLLNPEFFHAYLLAFLCYLSQYLGAESVFCHFMNHSCKGDTD